MGFYNSRWLVLCRLRYCSGRKLFLQHAGFQNGGLNLVKNLPLRYWDVHCYSERRDPPFSPELNTEPKYRKVIYCQVTFKTSKILASGQKCCERWSVPWFSLRKIATVIPYSCLVQIRCLDCDIRLLYIPIVLSSFTVGEFCVYHKSRIFTSCSSFCLSVDCAFFVQGSRTKQAFVSLISSLYFFPIVLWHCATHGQCRWQMCSLSTEACRMHCSHACRHLYKHSLL